MVDVTIPDEATVLAFDASSVGPHVFDWTYFAKADLRISINGIELTQGEFTHVPNTTKDGGYDGGSFTLNNAVAGGSGRAWRVTQTVREDNYSAGPLSPQNISRDMAKIVAMAQDARRDIESVLDAALAQTSFVVNSGWEEILLAAPATANYSSRAVAVASRIPAPVTWVRTGGYASPGDLGHGRYKRVGSVPSHAGYFTSLDGAIWEYCEGSANVHAFGAKGDDTADDYIAIRDAVQYANTKLKAYQPTLDVTGSYIQATAKVYFSPGKIYRVGTTVQLQQVTHLVAWGAIFRKHGSMTGACFQSQSGGGNFFGRYFTLEGGVFDGFEEHVRLDNGNIGGGRIHFERTEFWGATVRSCHLKCESSFITFKRPVWQQNKHSLLLENATAGAVAMCEINDILLQQPRWSANNQNAIEVRGFYNSAVDNAGDVLVIRGGAFSGFEEATHSYTGLGWIKHNNGQAVKCYDVRFPREVGGVPAVDNYTSFRTADTAPPTEIVLENCELADNTSHTSDRVHGVRLHAMPNILTVSGCKTSLYVQLVRFAAGTTPSALISGGTRDLIKVNVRGNWSAFQSSVTPVSDPIPSDLVQFDIWLKGTFRYTKGGTNQTGVADNTNTDVTFGTKVHDNKNLWDATNSRLTGFHGKLNLKCIAACSGTLTTPGTGCYLVLFKNGSPFDVGKVEYPNGNNVCLIGDWLLDSVSTDVWKVDVVLDTSSGTGTVAGATGSTYLLGIEL